jgi:hypothetical protein
MRQTIFGDVQNDPKVLHQQVSEKSTEPDRKKDFLLQLPRLPLPTGGGAIRSIDEKFKVNAVHGTAGVSIPLPFSGARGFSPSLSLDYNSGSGNVIFGIGWALGLTSIRRKTENGWPLYNDASESATFQLSGAKDLVPVFKGDADSNLITDADGNYEPREFDHTFGTTAYRVKYYHRRLEGLFSRIERWTANSTLSRFGAYAFLPFSFF